MYVEQYAGADVNHAAPGSQAPSIAALVGSLNSSITAFTSRISLQPKVEGKKIEEIIADLTNMVRYLLEVVCYFL